MNTRLLISLVVTLIFSQQIVAQISDYEICDNNNDGFAQFDLTLKDAEVINGQPNMSVTYHLTEADAVDGINALASPYTNITNPQTIATRLENIFDATFEINSFDIIAKPLPIVSTPTPLELCDNAYDGEDHNGYVQEFMLTDKDAEILNGQEATVSYHFTQAEAENGINAISSPFENTISHVQTLFVRVESLITCYTTTTLTVRVNPLPTPITPEPVEACDANANGFEEFELGAALITEIQNGEPGVTITFHETLTDAQYNVNALVSPYFNISAYVQIIYARGTNDLTGCYKIVEVQLITNIPPTIYESPDMAMCDDDSDGDNTNGTGVSFNFSNQTVLIENGQSEVTTTYYLSELDASDGQNAIGDIYSNSINPETIYVRVENDLTGCVSFVDFDLIVLDCQGGDVDNDADGVPNTDEDINEDGNFGNDDTDNDGIPNYLDDDDDGDGVLTSDETTGSGSGRNTSYVFIDTDDDTIENYLDNDDDGDGVLTIDEDYNQNGDPLDDDTNSNGIPDFLDNTVSIGFDDFSQNIFSVYPNPANNILTIEFKEPQSHSTIIIYNIQGQKVYDRIQEIQGNSTQIDVSNYRAGVYFVKVSSGTKTQVKKIVIE